MHLGHTFFFLLPTPSLSLSFSLVVIFCFLFYFIKKKIFLSFSRVAAARKIPGLCQPSSPSSPTESLGQGPALLVASRTPTGLTNQSKKRDRCYSNAQLPLATIDMPSFTCGVTY